MKTIRYVIAATFISTALFVGCKKDDNMAVNNGYKQTTDKGTTAGANVLYKLQAVMPQPGHAQLLQWNTGYMTSSEILFDGMRATGNIHTKEDDGAKAAETFVFPGTATLGTVDIPLSLYSSGIFLVNLNPMNSNNTLLLNGTCNIINITPDMPPVHSIPVQLVINEPITLTSATVGGMNVTGWNYEATLYLEVAQLENGIDADMLAKATLTNGTMVISSNSNANLYGIIVANLKNTMLKVGFGAQATSQMTTVTAAVE